MKEYSLHEIIANLGTTRRTAQDTGKQAIVYACLRLLWRQEVSRDETQVSRGEVDIEDRRSFGRERLHQVAAGPHVNGVLVDRKRGETYVMKLSSASCSFPIGSALVFAPAPLAFLFLGNPN